MENKEYCEDEQFVNVKELTANEYENCTFKNCDFTGKRIVGKRFIQCVFVDCDLSLTDRKSVV